MNVLLVVPWDDTRGGVISVVANLASHLKAAGHGVLFFHSGGLLLRRTVTKLGFDGVQLRLSLPFGPGLGGLLRALIFPLFVANLLQLIWFLRRHRIEVVNLHYPNDNFVYFAICRRLLQVRLVTSVHGRDAFYREKPKDHYSLAFRFVINSSDLVVLPSEAYRRLLLEAFPAMQDRTTFIHNGIDPEQFSPGQSRPTSDESNRYILCIAELREYKAIDVLLHAVQSLFKDDPELTLVLAGDGPLRGQLEGLASFLGIRPRTMFLGKQGAPEIVRLLRGCQALVLPSRMEPFGIVLIEAMACKTPVVATRVGGIPEIVEHEVSGILTEPESAPALADALRRVLTDATLRQRMVENAYVRVMERFCASHNGVAYLSAFESVLEPGFPQSPSRRKASSASGL